MQGVSGDLEDLLPGLCALCHQWLSDVVFQRFRGMAQGSFDLNEWFSNPRVAFHLRVRPAGLTDSIQKLCDRGWCHTHLAAVQVQVCKPKEWTLCRCSRRHRT